MSTNETVSTTERRPAEPPIKCLVWDLDETLWHGILLEDLTVRLRADLVAVIRELDRRGVLHSVASRNEPAAALAELHRAEIADYFLHPQIGWDSKATSVTAVADALGIGLDSLAFVDDDPVERAEVAFNHPAVRCYHPDEMPALLHRTDLFPSATTPEAARRREYYRGDIARAEAEAAFDGSRIDFLRSLHMRLTVAAARPADLDRIHELVLRTNQLNSTGRVFSHEELRACLDSDRYESVVVELTDRFGAYGTIGFVLVERSPHTWSIRLILTSCRVLSRGIAGVLLQLLANRARAAGVALRAEFVDTGRNRPMFVAFRLAGFRPFSIDAAGVTSLECDTSVIRPLPEHLTIVPWR
ncbi:HAD-IIIC family phosphatase [Plantactinospora sp. DSM 117369]